MADWIKRAMAFATDVVQDKIGDTAEDIKAGTESALLQKGLQVSGYTTQQSDSISAIVKKQGGLQNLGDSMRTYVFNPLVSFFKLILDGLMFRGPRLLNITVWFIIISIVLGIALYIAWKKRASWMPGAKKPGEVAAQQIAGSVAGVTSTAASTTLEGFQAVPAESVATEEAGLVNLQPLSIGAAGYLEADGTGRFDPPVAVKNALEAGFRTFILPIDYLDVAKGEGFEKPGIPTLMIRSKTGGLLSTNTGSIEEVAKAIAITAYRPEVPNYTQPVVLFLYILRSPNAVRAQKDYEAFLRNIATALAPLAPTHLGLTPLGNFHRARGEAELLTMPITALEGKTIILSNANTTLSHRQAKEGTIEPVKDLDYWINMRVYLESDAPDLPQMGVSRTADTAEAARAVVVQLDELLARSQVKADSFASKGRNRFTIAIPADITRTPTPEEISRALNDFGVNCVPMHPFAAGATPEKVKQLVQEYSGMSFRPKPAALRKITA